jgi:DNA processing protein
VKTAASWPPEGAPRFEIGVGDSGYPEALRAIEDPPPVIRGIGDPAALRVGLAVVGARRATPYGLAAARLFAGWAAEAGYPIVSGAALGCDQAAHRAALAAEGITVAVLGTGADMVYPSGCASLLAAIARRGAVISELDWGHPPAKWTFRARNRIIAGLSAALLVLEANCPSGTFLTADYALASGREVLVVPGSIFAPECRGPNRLLRQGATPVCEVSDLAGILSELIGPPSTRPDRPSSLCGSPSKDAVLSALRTNPARPDDLARSLGLDIVTVARRVGALEASGLVRKYRDGRYGPC